MKYARISDRIAAAISRAAARYSGETYTFVSPGGAKVQFVAVKKDADVDALAPISGVAAARRFEFVAARRVFDAIAAVLSNEPNQTAAALFEPFRRSQIIGTDRGGRNRVYKFDAARPVQENSPDGGSVRFFVYEGQ